MSINTYPEMNREIKKLLRLGGSNSGLYAAQRIEELEREVERLEAYIESFASCSFCGTSTRESNRCAVHRSVFVTGRN